MAAASFTSSLRSSGWMARAITGGGGRISTRSMTLAPPVSVVPVRATSRRARATVSPAVAGPRLPSSVPIIFMTPATRPLSPVARVSCVPSCTVPASTRATAILPPWAVCRVFTTCTTVSPPAERPRRSRVAAIVGAS